MSERKQVLYCQAHDVFMDLLGLPGDVHPLEVARAMAVCAHIMHVSMTARNGMGTPIWDDLIQDCKAVVHRRISELLDSLPGESEDSQ